jgi:hypothetical protein
VHSDHQESSSVRVQGDPGCASAGTRLNCDTLPSHCIDVLSEVIAPEVVAHLIASDLGVQYDEALRDEAAWEYGNDR